MVVKKPRIVIIGAGMAGLTAANKLYTAQKASESFELCVFEGGTRIGGRINTSEFGGDRIEMGATWIHGIGNSPVYKIAQEINSLESEQPWECMDGFLDDPITIAEGGIELSPSVVDSVSAVFNSLMDFAKGDKVDLQEDVAVKAFLNCASQNPSLGSFLRNGLEAYWAFLKNGEEDVAEDVVWSREMLEEAIFAMHENIQRTYTSAGDLLNLDYNAESEYQMFPGEEITIAKGYLSIIESIASVLPAGLIQLGRKVIKIEWQPGSSHGASSRPVKLHFSDGTTFTADHVIVTVSLGVLKARIHDDPSMFAPPLPSFKNQAISRLGYGVVNKLFLQVSTTTHDQETNDISKFPFLQMVFHQSGSKLKNPNIPWWLRRTAFISPIYKTSSVVLSWLAGKEALALESLSDEEILDKVSTTISTFLSNPSKLCNGNATSFSNYDGSDLKFTKVLRTKWGSDPLFLGSYSYIAVGSSGDDIDKLAEPLPENGSSPPLQILFAGEATHRTHYSTTHGAYFSGLREANRLLQYYKCNNNL